MKCEEVRFEIAVAETGDRSPAATAHLARCAECRAYAARDASLRNLLRIKRHETPDPHFETRLVARVRDEIEGTAPSKSWMPAGVREWFVPALRWAAATAAVAVVGLHVLRPGVMPQPSPDLAGPSSAPQPVSMYADGRAAAATSAVPPMMAALTNQGPPLFRLNPGSGIEYGTGGTVPVRFDY